MDDPAGAMTPNRDTGGLLRVPLVIATGGGRVNGGWRASGEAFAAAGRAELVLRSGQRVTSLGPLVRLAVPGEGPTSHRERS